jgi:hypothetical protein
MGERLLSCSSRGADTLCVGSPTTPIAAIYAYRKTSRAVVTIVRLGRSPRRYWVGLKRSHVTLQWVLCGKHSCKTSGALFLRGSFDASLWTAQLRKQTRVTFDAETTTEAIHAIARRRLKVKLSGGLG